MAKFRITWNPATPLPWEAKQIGRYGRFCALFSKGAFRIGKADEFLRDDAAYIVHAVNTYPQLVGALRACCFDPELVGLDQCRSNATALLRELGESK